MALSDENGVNVSMPVAPMNGFGGFGSGDWSWIIILLPFGMFGGWGNGNNGFGGNNLYPWLLNNNTQNGFDNAATAASLAGIQNAITTGFSNAEVANCGRTIDSLNRSFDTQTAITSALYGINNGLQNCCCENRLGLANLGADIAREACSTRTTDTQNTQVILSAINDGFKQMSDQRYQDKIDEKNDIISQLRQEALYARGQASQVSQNANIINGIYDRLNTCPVGTVPVYGEQPIFTCPNNNNFGCGCNVA